MHRAAVPSTCSGPQLLAHGVAGLFNPGGITCTVPPSAAFVPTSLVLISHLLGFVGVGGVPPSPSPSSYSGLHRPFCVCIVSLGSCGAVTKDEPHAMQASDPSGLGAEGPVQASRRGAFPACPHGAESAFGTPPPQCSTSPVGHFQLVLN